MAITEKGPKIAAIKMILDEIYPLIICNQITVSVDNPSFNIQMLCINPNREIWIRITDIGDVRIEYRTNVEGCNIAYPLSDPDCAKNIVRFIIDTDKQMLNSFIAGTQVILDKWEELRPK